MTKVSFITASYNYENYIKETIESVLNQTYTDWEMIIVDDGSKDNSVEVIKNYCQKDERIKLFQHENGVNKGLIETIKLGIEKAQGEWIAFLESDDSVTSDYLEEKLKITEQNPNVKFIFNDINLIGDEDAIKEIQHDYFDKFYKIINRIKTKNDYIKEFKSENIVPTFSVVMLKKEILKDIKYDAAVPQWIDYYLWTQLVYKYDFYYLNKKLTNWRMHKTSYNNRRTDSYEGVYFLDVQVADNLSGGKHRFFHKLWAYKNYVRAFKRKFIRIHPKDREITILGKKIKY